MTGPDVAGPARRTLRVLVLPVLVLIAALPLGTAARPAGADTVSNLQSRAGDVAHRLVLEQLQVDAARQQASVATARLADDAQAITQITQQLATDQQAIAHHLHIVQTHAILSYIDSGAHTSSTDTALFGGGTAQAQAASEYATLAVSNITAELAQLHTVQRTLQSRQVALQARQSQDRTDRNRLTTSLGQADAAAAALRAEQAGLTGQLAVDVAAQQTTQVRAAATAVARTPKTSTSLSSVATNTPATIPVSTPAATASSGASGGDPYPNLSDPALNPFLTCVIQAESGGNYGIVSPNGLYMGAFQFSQPTWNTAAAAAGLGLLVGVPPNHTSKPEQDTVAVALFSLDGQRPWLGDRCSA